MAAAGEDVYPLGRRRGVVKRLSVGERCDVVAVAVKHEQGRSEARHGAEAWVPVGDQERRDERIVVAGEGPDTRERGLQDQPSGRPLEREVQRDRAAE